MHDQAQGEADQMIQKVTHVHTPEEARGLVLRFCISMRQAGP